MQQLLLYCRAGFESECTAEIQDYGTTHGISGFSKAKPQSGFVVFTAYENTHDSANLVRQINFNELIFARQLLFSAELLTDLPASDRIAPLFELARTLSPGVADVWLETPDTNEGKTLATFCRKFSRPLRQALTAQGFLQPAPAGLPRLHLFFLDSATVYIALSWPQNASRWPMGIPRLKLSRAAPSRSALKLEEALHSLLTVQERSERLRPGMQAVDLGAAPGGWSWQLGRDHIRVTAVDNGPLDAGLLAAGLVEHRREDGFRFRPRKPVDWMVCDMVEQPSRIAGLVAGWLAAGDCRDCIFNLKLPMKKRYAEVQRCREIIAKTLGGKRFELRLKQLYHDREEVTGYLHLW